MAYAAYYMQHLLQHLMSLQKTHISSFGRLTEPHWGKKNIMSSGLVNCAAVQNVTEGVLRVHVCICENISFLCQAPILSSSPDPLCDLWPFYYYDLPIWMLVLPKIMISTVYHYYPTIHVLLIVFTLK